jgi:hypothetical protein
MPRGNASAVIAMRAQGRLTLRESGSMRGGAKRLNARSRQGCREESRLMFEGRQQGCRAASH